MPWPQDYNSSQSLSRVVMVNPTTGVDIIPETNAPGATSVDLLALEP